MTRIPTRFHPSTQGCVATLGHRRKESSSTPKVFLRARKRQRAGAVQDASSGRKSPVIAPASWTAAALRRYSPNASFAGLGKSGIFHAEPRIRSETSWIYSNAGRISSVKSSFARRLSCIDGRRSVSDLRQSRRLEIA